jgi:hypothetical protein
MLLAPLIVFSPQHIVYNCRYLRITIYPFYSFIFYNVQIIGKNI